MKGEFGLHACQKLLLTIADCDVNVVRPRTKRVALSNGAIKKIQNGLGNTIFEAVTVDLSGPEFHPQ